MGALPGACAELSSEEKIGLGGLWLVRGADGRERAGIRWVAGGLRSDLVGVTSVCGYRGGVSELVGACEVGSSGTEEAWGDKLIQRLPSYMFLFSFRSPFLFSSTTRTQLVNKRRN